MEEILKAITTLCIKVDSIDNEIQKLKTNEDNLKSKASQQHDYKNAELRRSEDGKNPELKGDDGKLLKTHNICLNTAAELLTRYCKLIGHKYPDHICSKCNGEDDVIPDVQLKIETEVDKKKKTNQKDKKEKELAGRSCCCWPDLADSLIGLLLVLPKLLSSSFSCMWFAWLLSRAAGGVVLAGKLEEERKGKRRQQGEERTNRGFAEEGDGVSPSRRRRWRRGERRVAAPPSFGEQER
ncbi:hypothetical protein MTR67_012454 [Solanum verrucosum]|uniref:Uncharacterized protein n=1 Tax=Solanum verrucosum TaxID=315347 RepID=A0AAF0QFQ0_SOLVR|nr:hypothetical protein MTR67_012454 [Solanum verrucosum]